MVTVKRSFQISVLVSAFLLPFGQRAWSSTDCSIPQFNPQQHVYISSALQADRDLQDNLDGLDFAITSAGAPSNITPYVVACQEEASSENHRGVKLASEVVQSWKANSDEFKNMDRALVIVWVRNYPDAAHGSIGAIAGGDLRKAGFTEEFFASPGGPVLGEIRRYMPVDPRGEFIYIVMRVGQKQSAEEAPRETPDLPINTIMLMTVGLFIALGWFILKGNPGMADYKEAVRKRSKEDVAKIFAAMKASKEAIEKLAGVGVEHAAFQTEWNEVWQRFEAADQQIRAEIEQSLKTTAQLVIDSEKLRETLSLAIELHGTTIPTAEAALEQLRVVLVERRLESVNYAFPNRHTPEWVAHHFAFAEEGADLDGEFERAKEALAEARTRLLAGAVSEAQLLCTTATDHLTQANTIISETSAAKAQVEEVLPSLREMVERLLTACEEAMLPLEELSKEFAPVNFADVANNVEAARTLVGGVDVVVEEVALSYFRQAFLAAKTRLDKLVQDIEAAHAGLAAIGETLVSLRGKREKILAGLDKAGQRVQELGTKLDGQGDRVRPQARAKYESMQEAYRTVSQGTLEQNSAVNWLVLWTAYEIVSSDFRAASASSPTSSFDWSSSKSSSSTNYGDSGSGSGSISSISSISSGGSFGDAGGGSY